MLSRYLGELRHLPLLDAKQEVTLAAEIERLELARWAALLSYRPAVETVAQAVVSRVPAAAPRFAALRRSMRARSGAQKAIASAARQLRKLDFTRAALNDADAAVREAFAADPRARAYLARVARTREAERRAKGRFVAANLRLVISMARRYRHALLPLSDLIQEGNLGLMRAVDRFDHHRGYRFSTYATWWIRHAINRAVADKGRLVRVPVHALDDMARVERARSAAVSATGEAPSHADLAAQLEMSPAKLEVLRTEALLRYALSLDAAAGEDRDQTLYDVLPALEESDRVEALDQQAFRETLDQLLGSSLTSMEAAVLRFRFGLHGGDELTLREIGSQYNLSRERIRQIQEEALTKLRGAIRRLQTLGAARSRAAA